MAEPRLRSGLALISGPLVALVACAVVLVSDGDTGLVPLARLRDQVDLLRERAQALERERRALLADVRALRRDAEAVEAVAREDLGMVRPGELVIRWPDSEGD